MGEDSEVPRELVVVIPSRGRHERLASLAAEFARTTPRHRLLFVVDWDDPRTQKVARGLGKVMLMYSRAGYCCAVNVGIAASKEPFVLVASDDCKPHKGWFERAKAYMSETVGFVSLNDLGNPHVMAGAHATFPLVARWYADLGPLYDESYHHNGCDADASFRAKERGAFAYAPDAIIEHLHPSWNKNEIDATYAEGGLNEAKNADDLKLLAVRWGPELDSLGML